MFLKLRLLSFGLKMKSSIKSPTFVVVTVLKSSFISGVVIFNFKDFSTATLMSCASVCKLKWSNSMAADKIEAIGLAIPLPAAWGYEPCIGSNILLDTPIEALEFIWWSKFN